MTMLRFIFASALPLALCVTARADQRAFGWCELGGSQINVSTTGGVMPPYGPVVFTGTTSGTIAASVHGQGPNPFVEVKDSSNNNVSGSIAINIDSSGNVTIGGLGTTPDSYTYTIYGGKGNPTGPPLPGYYQKSFPGCTVTVYLTGSGGTKAPIYSDNNGTPLANPFTIGIAPENLGFGYWYFYAANGTYDVQFSGGGIVTPFTLGAYSLFDPADFLNPAPGFVVPAAGAPTQVQFNLNNTLGASPGFTWSGNGVTSSLGFTSAANNYSGFTSVTDGSFLRGYLVGQNAAMTAGGYLDFTPVTYNPYGSSSVCHDPFGNVVTQPLPLNGYTFGPSDIIMWSSTSPWMPSNGSCGTPLPVTPASGVGLNINTYFYARGGFASDLSSYATIQLLNGGGVTAGSITAGTLYPTGTITTGGVLTTPTYLGGYIVVGNSVGHPQPGTIATVTNPLSTNEGYIQGIIYFDNALQQFVGSYGSLGNVTWAPIDGGGGSGATCGPINAIQFAVASGGGFVCGGSTNLQWNGTSISVTGGAGNGFQGPVFSTSNTGHNNAFVTPASTIYADGTAGFQGLFAASGSSSTGFFIGSCSPSTCTSAGYGLNGNGVLTVASCSGCGGSGSPGGSDTQIQVNHPTGTFAGFSSLTYSSVTGVLTVGATGSTPGMVAPVFSTSATGHNNAFVTPSSTLYADGTAGFQTLYASSSSGGGFFIGSCTPSCTSAGWGLNNVGALTVSSCSGCGGSGSPGGVLNSVQYNNPLGSLGGTGAFTFNPSTGILTITGTGSSGFQGPVFSSSVTTHANAFTDALGNFAIYGDGTAGFQSVSLTSGWTIASTPYGITASGALTVSSCSGCGGGGGAPGGPVNSIQINGPVGVGGTFTGLAGLTFNGSVLAMNSGTIGIQAPVFSTINTGHNNAFVTPSSTLWADGTAGFQSVNSTNGFFIGAYPATSFGINSSGAAILTAATATGTFNSQASSFSTYGFILANNKFLVDGVGDVSMTGQLNVVGTFSTGSCSSGFAICINSLAFLATNLNMNANTVNLDANSAGGVLAMRSATIINNAGTFVGAGVDSRGAGIGGTGFNFWNGSGYQSGQTHFFTNVQTGTGSCNLNFAGGVLVAYSGSGC